jgi:hypothetical protein
VSFIDPSILECFLHAHEAWGSVMTDLLTRSTDSFDPLGWVRLDSL